MSIIYIDYEPVEIKAGTLKDWLFKQFPLKNAITLDTESSGLYVDGNWKEGPPARVSAVSMAWREKGGKRTTVALPFDQGCIGGKPGRWSDALNDYEVMPHTSNCLDGVAPTCKPCTCAPWNLNREDWEYLCCWLTGAVGAELKSITFHNGKYDCHIMKAGLRDGACGGGSNHMSGVDLEPLWGWDTMLAQGIINPLDTSALKPTGERLFGYSARIEEAAVLEALKHNGVGLTKRYDIVPWDIMGPYAAKDADITDQLEYRQEELISEGAVTETDRSIIDGWSDTPVGRIQTGELPLAKLLFRMEQRRVGLDVEGMREEARKMEDEIKKIEKDLPFEATINAAKKYFFDTLGIVPIKVSDICGACTFNRVKKTQRKNTKKSLCVGQHQWNASLDAEVVARLVADKVPGAAEWAHLSNMNSALSKWYRAWPHKAVETKDGYRIMTNFRQGRIESDRKGMNSGGAISGRLSAERIQLQGVPKDYRIPENIRGIKPKKDGTPGLIQAKPGYQLWEIDASNAEVRVAAWLAQCRPLAEVINSGVNIHDGNTRNLFGLEPDSNDWELHRTVAKTTIFGDLYGAGVRTLKAQIEAATKLEFPESKVRAFKQALKAAYPELSATARRCQAKADKSMGGCGWVRLVNGRKRVFGWGERTHKAFNACIQGGVAETMKTLMLMIEHAYPGILVNQVHDSNWVEVPDFNADLIVADIQSMGAELFTKTFSTEDLTVNFEFDAKRIG